MSEWALREIHARRKPYGMVRDGRVRCVGNCSELGKGGLVLAVAGIIFVGRVDEIQSWPVAAGKAHYGGHER